MDPQVCYVCAITSEFYSRNLFKTKSKYSETRIYDFICKFLGEKPSARLRQRCQQSNNGDNDDCVCIECLGKIDEYDLATITAQRVENELRGLLLHAESSVNAESKVICAGDSGGDDAEQNDTFEAPIETIEMLDQFKIENSCSEPNEPNDSFESVLTMDDCNESTASDSDEDYLPLGSLKKRLNRTAAKSKRKMDNVKDQKQQHQPNSQLKREGSNTCAVCQLAFKRYIFG